MVISNDYVSQIRKHIHHGWYRIGLAKSTTPCLTPAQAPAAFTAWNQDVSEVELKLFQGWTKRTKYQWWLKWLCRDSPESADCFLALARIPTLWLSSVSAYSPPPHTLWVPKLAHDAKRFQMKHSIGCKKIIMIRIDTSSVCCIFARMYEQNILSGNSTIRHITLKHQKECPPYVLRCSGCRMLKRYPMILHPRQVRLVLPGLLPLNQALRAIVEYKTTQVRTSRRWIQMVCFNRHWNIMICTYHVHW